MANKAIDKSYLLQTLRDFDADILKKGYIEKYATFSAMPAASATTEGKIIQYVGADDSTNNLKNGYFYIVQQDATTPGTYKWEEKAVMEIPAGVEYSIVKETTADPGYIATYQLYGATAGGTPSPIVGSTKINIPKDFLVKSGTVNTVTAADKAAGGKFDGDPNFQVGDKYIDFVVNVKAEDPSDPTTDEHIYINVKDLVDVYTAGEGIDISTVSGSQVVKIKLNIDQLTGSNLSGLKFAGASNDELAIDFETTQIDFDTEW